MKTGLLGRKLGHSWSPLIHGLLGNPSYELLEREEEELAQLFARKDLRGLNVTIPYKKTVLPFLTEITGKARRIGCVNTVLFEKDGRRIGDNTDYDGFAGTLDAMQLDVSGKRVLILGTGATSDTVLAVCEDRGAKSVRKLSRRDLPPDADARETDVLINCTPAGMFPDIGTSLVKLQHFRKLSAVIDVVYNPHRTKLLLTARQLGIPHSDGLRMLVRQAIAASEQFLDTSYEDAMEETILRTIRSQTDNVILVGMPGCGKTTIGKKLAEALHKEFIDIDACIEADTQMPIPVFFEAQGEPAFRALEKKWTEAAGKTHNQVIATGGGVVKDPDNFSHLAQNGRIYYLKRPLDQLATRGRPLSAGGKETLQRLFAERDPLYRAFSDVIVEPGNIETVTQRVQEDFYAHCHH